MVRDLSPALHTCAINTATLGFQKPIGEVIDAVARHGFGGISPWRREVEGDNAKAIGRQIRNAGLTVPGYCRSTFLPATSVAAFNANVADNKRAIADAASLGAATFVMVVGGLPPGCKSLDDARNQVREATAELLSFGKSVGVKIALEPLHPIYAAERSCLTKLSEALDWCDHLEGSTANPWLGVCIDVYHVWWDADVMGEIARAGKDKRIFGFHVCDWLVPTRDILNDRGMMGDGVIDVRRLRTAVETAGFTGSVEVEIFSSLDWWKRPIDETLRVARDRLGSAT